MYPQYKCKMQTADCGLQTGYKMQTSSDANIRKSKSGRSSILTSWCQNMLYMYYLYSILAYVTVHE